MSADEVGIPELFGGAPELDRSVRDAEVAVTRWIWTRENSDRWRAEPLWAIRVGLRPGGDFKAPPKRLHRVERYGYDAADRLRLGQRYEDGAVEATLIADEADDVSTRWEFDGFGSLQTLTRAVFDPSTKRVVSSDMMSRTGSKDGCVTEGFSYDEAGRLSIVRFEREGGDYERWTTLRRGEQHISYGPDSNPVRVVERYDDPSAEPHVIYERVGESSEALIDAVREPLVQAIVAAVTSSFEELAMVTLYYPSADLAAPPPVVYACSTARRAELIEEWGYDRVVLLPPEWRQDQLELQLPAATADACNKLKMLVEQGCVAPGALHELMLSLAAALASYAWPPSVSRADDFAVYAVDADGEDLERNVAASVPEHQVDRWRELGMLDRAG